MVRLRSLLTCCVFSLVALTVLAGCAVQWPAREMEDTVHEAEIELGEGGSVHKAEIELGEGGSIHVKRNGLDTRLEVRKGRLIYNGQDAGEYHGEPLKIRSDGVVLRDGQPLPSPR